MHKTWAVGTKLLSFLTSAIVMAAILGGNVLAVPHESVIVITDASPTGSPVAVAGTVSVREEASGSQFVNSFRTDASASNVSQKSILAVVITIDTKGASKIDLHNSRKDDYFFRTEALEPSATLRLEESAGPFGEPRAEVEMQPAQPRAVAAVVFVQFTDGSIWGDSAAGKDVLRERRLTWDRLNFLVNTYRTSGNQGFVEELKQSSQLDMIENLQKLYGSSSNDPTNVIRKIASMIENAERHQRAMTSGSERLAQPSRNTKGRNR